MGRTRRPPLLYRVLVSDVPKSASGGHSASSPESQRSQQCPVTGSVSQTKRGKLPTALCSPGAWHARGGLREPGTARRASILATLAATICAGLVTACGGATAPDRRAASALRSALAAGLRRGCAKCTARSRCSTGRATVHRPAAPRRRTAPRAERPDQCRTNCGSGNRGALYARNSGPWARE